MLLEKNHTLTCKVSIEYRGKTLIGKNGADILEAINSEQSISNAAKKIEMSYRYVWNYIQDVENLTKQQIVETYKGGKLGGGGAKLTDAGKQLLNEYKQVASYVNGAVFTKSNSKTELVYALKGKIC
jgi:molybdate transport system regulatory protein